MALVQASSSPLPAIGMLAGLLLLSFAGLIAVAPSSWGEPSGQPGFLPRRLPGVYFGFVTTSRAPSSLDSSDSSSIGSSLESSKSLESGSLQSSEWDVVWPKLLKSFLGSMGSLTATLLIQVLFAVLYFRVVTDPLQGTGSLDEKMVN